MDTARTWRLAAVVGAALGIGMAASGQPGALPRAVPVPGDQPDVPEPEVEAPAPKAPDMRSEDPDAVTLSAFAEPVAMNTLVELVTSTLNINVTVIGDVPGTVRFNAPVPVKKSELLGLLATLLEQQGWAITKDRFGLYTVHANAAVVPNATGDLPTTRVFRTPNIRPSSLKQHIEGLIGIPMPNSQGGGQRQYAYVDDLGVIVATDTPRRLESLNEVLNLMLAEDRRMAYTRVALEHITASVARERSLQLIGQAQQAAGSTRVGVPGGEGGQGQPTPRNLSTLYSLADRLTVDQQGNALIFRGTPDEVAQVRQVIAVIDVPNELVPRAYEAGRSAAQVADIARGRGLGEVITITPTNRDGFNGLDIGRQQQQLGLNRQGQNTPSVGGPLMVVDEQRGQIVYYGTESQQVQLAALLEQLDTQAESVVTRVYKLRNADAEEVAEIINGIISNTTPVGESSLLPGDSGSRPGFRAPRPTPSRQAQTPQPAGGGGEDGIALDATNAFVYPDIKNNQLLVKAQAGQQSEFAKLIEKLDLRRPQVFVEAKIIAVNADDRLRTAFETQLINANATGGVFTQSFGLANYGSGSTITTPPTVNALTGFTAAIIRNDMVPIVMTALANETDSRIISNPQLLVDDNEEATVVSLDQQPTSTLSRGSTGQTDVVTAGDYAEAGTTLTVTPQISDGGYMRLKYNIQLSSFTGEGSVVGGTTLPPPRQENTLSSESITVPSDSTVVVGGLVVESKTKSVAKIPLLGDIPLLGLLFQDRSTGDRKTVLYVFLTPRVLRDPTFQDLKLLTKGPRGAVNLADETPKLRPSKMEIVMPRGGWGAVPEPAPSQPAPRGPEEPEAPALPGAAQAAPGRVTDEHGVDEPNPD
ncbi:MAG: secretin N-terminal domain-containing protein [Planctomycetota bacterium]|nr:secretin N-terminal domain-containing protein [Planctomycetota bacterium]